MYSKRTIYILIMITGLWACSSQKHDTQVISSQEPVISSPPLGWNSFDSYSCNIYEELALKEIDAFIKKFAPHGYEYFVIDNGWFSNPKVERKDGLLLPVHQHANPADVLVNEYGIVQPSDLYFPEGLKSMVDKLHDAGLKFGVHLMRGIPRVAVERNLPIEGTNYTARDIYIERDNCTWCEYMHGVDMSKPGAQEYYNSIFNQFAEWGIDFVKIDDVSHKPAEIEAYVEAIKQCGRQMVLSLSPGGGSNIKYLDTYRKTNMVRTTPDIWDNQRSIDLSFESMRKWQGLEKKGFYPDLDMVPFGELCILNRQGTKQKRPNQSEAAFSGYLHHWCFFTEAQKETFITQRAIAASPIMIGGSMISMDDHSFELLTNKEMLSCVKNGVHGKLVHSQDSFELWNAPLDNDKEFGFLSYKVNEGWFAVFNRSEDRRTFKLNGSFTKFLKSGVTYQMFNVWEDETISDYQKHHRLSFTIDANGAVFIKYKI